VATATDYTCPQCGKSFGSQHALGGHLSAAHRKPRRDGEPWQKAASTKRKPAPPAPPAPPPTAAATARDFSFKARIAALQRDAAEPFRIELRDIETKLAELNTERAELMQMRSQLQVVLRKLEITQPGPKQGAPAQRSAAHAAGNAARARKQHDLRVDAVRNYLGTHGDELSDGFTMSVVIDGLKRNGGMAMTTRTAASAFDTLRDQGLLRADRITRGGGLTYKLVNDNGGTA